MNDSRAVRLARQIAMKTIAGELDPLLACREIDDLRGGLAEVPKEVMNPIIGVSSEVDDLPIGPDRQYWSADALKLKDVEAADYRARVAGIVQKKMIELLSVLELEPVEE